MRKFFCFFIYFCRTNINIPWKPNTASKQTKRSDRETDQFVYNDAKEDRPVPTDVRIGQQRPEQWGEARRPREVGEGIWRRHNWHVHCLGEVRYHVGMESYHRESIANLIRCAYRQDTHRKTQNSAPTYNNGNRSQGEERCVFLPRMKGIVLAPPSFLGFFAWSPTKTFSLSTGSLTAFISFRREGWRCYVEA